ncbi:MAG: threonylcarbamoyl-AMP synthase [Candidatus Kapabacteria bacterium]|nr:threonylcarbamoyl-AMP synthase [Candidatus Kapabacteria bacterium]
MIIPIHPVTPEERNISIIRQRLLAGDVMLYPTDTGMALGCTLRNKQAIERIRRIRSMPMWKSMTFLCKDISNIAEFAKVSNPAYRLIKRLIPGPYTFILPATKAVPAYAHDEKRKTVGIRVPDAIVPQAILEAIGEPLISITAKDSNENEFATPEAAIEALGSMVDVTVTLERFSWMNDEPFAGMSTIINATTDEFSILREGAGIEAALEILGESAYL